MPRLRNSAVQPTRGTDSALDALFRRKEPLKDITHRFIGARKTEHEKPPPISGRNSKVPLRAKAIPSSLPPSSPIPSSSSFLAKLSSPSPEEQYQYTCHNDSDFDTPYAEHGLNIDDQPVSDYNDIPLANLSDPFGFVAVENKLKVERLQPKSRDRARIQSPRRLLQLSRTPLRSEKRLASNPLTSTSSGFLPSSPSPVKRASKRYHFQEDEEQTEEQQERAGSIVKAARKARARKGSSKGSGRLVEVEEPARAESVPKKPIRTMASRRAKTQKTKADADDIVEETMAVKTTRANSRKKPRKAADEKGDAEKVSAQELLV